MIKVELLKASTEKLSVKILRFLAVLTAIEVLLDLACCPRML
jgi:hypothetical protein